MDGGGALQYLSSRAFGAAGDNKGGLKEREIKMESENGGKQCR